MLISHSGIGLQQNINRLLTVCRSSPLGAFRPRADVMQCLAARHYTQSLSYLNQINLLYHLSLRVMASSSIPRLSFINSISRFSMLTNQSRLCNHSQYIGVMNYVSHGISTNPRWKCLCTRNRVLDRENSMYTITLMFSYFITLPKPLFCSRRGPA